MNEFLEQENKFKAGATSLEVIHNPQKYISSKFDLNRLELEDFISVNKDIDGEFRFDILWNATEVESGKNVKIYIDTKNYSSAGNMFSDLGQLKAYLKKINNFDELYIIQQGGRGVTEANMTNRLQSVIKADANNLYNELLNNNKTLLEKNNIEDFEDFMELLNDKNSILYKFLKVTYE